MVKGKGWPVIEFCSRTVRLSLRSDQNAFRIGTTRVGDRGRLRFEWVPRRAKVGAGRWTAGGADALRERQGRLAGADRASVALGSALTAA